MNDPHPSGTPSLTASSVDASYGYYPGYGQESTQSSWAGQTAPQHGDDPLFGSLPDGRGDGAVNTAYDASYQGMVPGYDGFHTGSGYPTTADETSAYGFYTGYDTTGYEGYGTYGAGYAPTDHGYGTAATMSPVAQDTAPYEDVTPYALYDTAAVQGGEAWSGAGGQEPAAPGYGYAYDAHEYASGEYGSPGHAAGEYRGAEREDTGYRTGEYGSGEYGAGEYETGEYQTGEYEAAEYGNGGYGTGEYGSAAEHGSTAYDDPEYSSSEYSAAEYDDPGYDGGDGYEAPEHGDGGEHADAEHEAPGAEGDPADGGAPEGEADGGPAAHRTGPSSRRAGAATAARNRRRRTAKRSALLTVAVPSACVMGVAAVAAATVVSPGADKDKGSTAQADDTLTTKTATAEVPTTKLDTQLTSLAAGADDFADRASRTQERLDLEQRQEQERLRKQREAARKEALRPKFALPVAQHGLSATYGQSGVNWMSLHTGIDFPVGLGTPVMAATDGTVRVQLGGAYGNMAIVTAADGTETWYCHLSSTRIRSGPVKAGDVIAYSGSSGNSTGPHMHFEVRPGGGSPIDPLQWLISKGLDPR